MAREIWVICETWEGAIIEASLELIGEGGRLASQRGHALVALVNIDGEGGGEALSQYLTSRGVDRVLILEGPHSADDAFLAGLVAELAEETRPDVLLMAATILGRSVMPRIAARLRTGLTADCTGLALDAEGLLIQTRPAYGDRLLAEIVCPRARPQMATVRPGVFPPPALASGRAADLIYCRSDSIDPGLVSLLSSVAEEGGGKSLFESRVVVAGGRGVGSIAGFRDLERLSRLIGGATGASRSAVEAGFAPYSKQIGQTGLTIRPELYIACGISGSIQHRAGFSAARQVIAINSDRQAPIFDHADYGIVGDLHTIIRMMIRFFEEGGLPALNRDRRSFRDS